MATNPSGVLDSEKMMTVKPNLNLLGGYFRKVTFLTILSLIIVREKIGVF
jgi:hypothetical protein